MVICGDLWYYRGKRVNSASDTTNKFISAPQSSQAAATKGAADRAAAAAKAAEDEVAAMKKAAERGDHNAQ